MHLYGQLVHDKTGCHLLEAQVSNLSCLLHHSLHSLGCRLISCSSSFLSLEHRSWPQLHGSLPDAGHLGGHKTAEGCSLGSGLCHLFSIYATSVTHHYDNSQKEMALIVAVFPLRATLALQTGVWISCRRRMSFLTSWPWLSTVRCCQYEGRLVIFSSLPKILFWKDVIILKWYSIIQFSSKYLFI